ncbi:MAG: tRNA (adenosine(37)-N6)-dimethylallyltransferase MiaA [Bacteroidales bacterium]|nr:tRNA (adenosine(37)-N6)-dimethylallyltransferase MiaA [Bacteroidales bacterium]NLO42570.1 tRNA (adenosine(37)-N6)-dimethylallyltransferase MiaA [Bacteroidales bacterium]
MSNKSLICIMGPTASGKTRLAAKLAYAVDGEIISADSRQVYKHMDIGTGKDLQEYTIDNVDIAIHLINIVPPGYHYSVFEYQRDFFRVYEEIQKRNRQAILCGGSGMYIDAVLNNYHLQPVPENKKLRESLAKLPMQSLVDILTSYKSLHNTSDTSDRQRLLRAVEIQAYYAETPTSNRTFNLDPILFYIHFERDVLRKRITQRLHDRLKNGMIQEVEKLMNDGLSADQLLYYGLEYKHIALYLTGKVTYEEMQEKLMIAIHQFAKRQETWFRRMQRNGFHMHYVEGAMTEDEKMHFMLQTLGNYTANYLNNEDK